MNACQRKQRQFGRCWALLELNDEIGKLLDSGERVTPTDVFRLATEMAQRETDTLEAILDNEVEEIELIPEAIQEKSRLEHYGKLTLQ